MGRFLMARAGRALRRLRSEQDGWALVIAMLLMAVMIVAGMALAMTVDVQGKQSGTQRTRETAFNLAEAALNAQVRAVGYKWPGSAGNAFTPCTQATPTPNPRCPVDAQLQRLIPSVDTRNGVTWKTEVRDNAGSFFYSDSLPQVGWDSENNGVGKPLGDGYVWVRAEATVGGRTRMMVGLVRINYQQEDIINAAVRTGRLEFSNAGRNKQFIDGMTGGVVQVRCDPAPNQPVCVGLDYPSAYIKDQADYDAQMQKWIQPYTREKIDMSPAMDYDALLRQRETAQQLATYYTSCPPNLTGRVVWIENVANCQVTINGTTNTADAPGMVIVNGGNLRIVGNGTYYGVLYYTNLSYFLPTPHFQDLSFNNPAAIDLSGTVAIKGGVILDGNTRLFVGDSNSGAAITFDGRGFSNVASIATADVVQNTWRELTK